MINYIVGDIMTVKTDYLAHQVSTLGIMEKGIALDIKKKYPNVYVDYNRKCKDEGDSLLGTYFPVKATNANITIINCFTQHGSSIKSKTTNYDDIKKVFKLIEKAVKPGKVVTVPYKYGCGIYNGEWEVIHRIFKDIFSDSKVILQIVRRFEWTEREME